VTNQFFSNGEIPFLRPQGIGIFGKGTSIRLGSKISAGEISNGNFSWLQLERMTSEI